MVVRESNQPGRVVGQDRQYPEVVKAGDAGHELGVWLIQGPLPEVDLDGDFPVRRGADPNLVRHIVNRGAGDGGEFRVGVGVPDESVRVEEQPHRMYSSKSFRCSSSSSMISIIPFSSPGSRRFGGAGGGSAIRRATGRSFSVITSCSPGGNWWISAGSSAWA